ncbi:hypothetical protein CFO_g2433 [Ceratocystis platani]|uniref:Uncharacterized protein n=1 Tax=Ceratocystis fimbriata f. sp. platani TaxID=88771 RepID=A0A0F8CX15_CERFI|nr:hypothetical protein CFO_g2433 [Ceratocystis platani]
MRFFTITSLSFLLVGANAHVLVVNGYTFQDLGDGLCTATSMQNSEDSGLPNKFEVNKADRTMTIENLNINDDDGPNKLFTSNTMAAVCRECGLEPKNLNEVAMTVSKDPCLESALNTYRSIHSDIEENEKIVATVILDGTGSDLDRQVWFYLFHCTSYEIVERMLTPKSILSKVSIEEGDEDCLMSYFIESHDEDDETTIYNAEGYGERYSDVWT